MWYSGRKADLWVEYKYLPNAPKRADVNAFELCSPLQQDWLVNRGDEGRNVALIVGSKDGGWIFKAVPSATIHKNKPPPFTRAQIAAWIQEQCCLSYDE